MKKPKSVAFHEKMRLQRVVLRQPIEQLSSRAKIVFVALIDCLNCETGRCNPTREILMTATGMKVDSIKRGLSELEAAGWIARKFTRGAPYYSFPFDRLAQDGGAYAAPASQADGGAVLHGWGRSSARMGAHTLRHGTEKNREVEEKGEASPPTLKRVEASPNGQQKKVTQLREISDKAKAVMERLRIKHLPFQPERWKEGHPDPEPTEEEQRELLAIVNGAEVIPMPKPKPAPIVLEPALLVSRSIFPGATGKVEPCGYPEMPDFLRRTPPAPEAAR